MTDQAWGPTAVRLSDGRAFLDANGAIPTTITGTVTASGTVTANAGTNLNTSLLALEAGGNLATIAGKDFSTETTLAALNAKVTAVNTGAVVISSGAVTVSATNLDIRDLTSVSDSVSAVQSGTWTVRLNDGTDTALVTALGELNVLATAQPGVDIGDVTINNAAGASAVNIQDGGNTITVDGSVGVSSISAGTTRIGGTYGVGGTIIDEVPTARSINRAFVNASASGNTELVATQGGGVRIRVLAVACVVGGTAVSVKFQSATSDISALFACAANGGFILPETPHGWFQTNANEALNVNLSGSVATGVQVIWVQAT